MAVFAVRSWLTVGKWAWKRARMPNIAFMVSRAYRRTGAELRYTTCSSIENVTGKRSAQWIKCIEACVSCMFRRRDGREERTRHHCFGCFGHTPHCRTVIYNIWWGKYVWYKHKSHTYSGFDLSWHWFIGVRIKWKQFRFVRRFQFRVICFQCNVQCGARLQNCANWFRLHRMRNEPKKKKRRTKKETKNCSKPKKPNAFNIVAFGVHVSVK